MSTDRIGPCTLEGKFVRLIPLSIEHKPSLQSAAKDSDFTWMQNDLNDSNALESWFSEMLSGEKTNDTYPFAVQLVSSGKIIGTTRYKEISSKHMRVEIGGTWYSREFWGTAVNPESKYLLLRHAFEDWQAKRVQLKTDSQNFHSQRAILKLGAKFEGKLRNHMIRRDGTVRDSMIFSITSEEWPEVSVELKARVRSFKD